MRIKERCEKAMRLLRVSDGGGGGRLGSGCVRSGAQRAAQRPLKRPLPYAVRRCQPSLSRPLIFSLSRGLSLRRSGRRPPSPTPGGPAVPRAAREPCHHHHHRHHRRRRGPFPSAAAARGTEWVRANRRWGWRACRCCRATPRRSRRTGARSPSACACEPTPSLSREKESVGRQPAASSRALSCDSSARCRCCRTLLLKR